MTPRTVEDVAASLCDLYSTEFDARKFGAFRMQREKFREFTGRRRLETSVILEIANFLRKRYKLVLVQGSDFFAVLSERQLDRVRVVPYRLRRRGRI